MNHQLEAIVVTGRYKIVEEARLRAINLELKCTPVVDSEIEGYEAFLIAPHAEGDLQGGICFAQWITWAADNRIDWVRVAYGQEAHVIDNSEP